KLRLRHPKGLSTLDIDLEGSSVQDLQQQILTNSGILPSQQDLKSGYPPRQLTLIPELPVSSLGLAAGDQIIVVQKVGSGAPVASSPTSAPSVSQAPARTTTTSASVPTPARSSVSAQPARANMNPSSGGGTGPEYVTTDAGVLIHRIVPDDNACLFNSVALVFEQDTGKAQTIRKIVAEAIRNDPINWTEAILGRSRESYIETILKPSSWGGAIELAILATHYTTEIASVDVETGRIDRFSPASSKPANRCILIYSGIHYDAASLAPMADAPPDFHQTVFSITSEDDTTDPILLAAKQLADKLRAKRAFTNTATFDLRCEICKTGLKGEKEARAHATQTGHASFGEY
ncbi:OTU-domain-containing protein, partial [Phellopilus nigrolimitatus]